MSDRFEIIMDPDAVKEYQKLDNSVITIVDKALSRLEKRADEIGKPLRNQSNSKLAGCKEIKLRDVGIRIVYRVTNQVVHVLRVVYVLAIEQRSDDFVFKLASKRLSELNHDPTVIVAGEKYKDIKTDSEN